MKCFTASLNQVKDVNINSTSRGEAHMKIRTFALAVITCAAVSGQAATITYDFNTSQADFNANFAATGAGEWSTSAVPGWTASAGVDNTGRIQSGGNNNTAVYLTASDFSTVGSSNTASIWFEARLNGSDQISGFANLGVGFTTGTTGTLSSDQYFAAELKTGTGSNMRLGYRWRESSTGGNADTDEFTLTDGNWYKLETTLTKESGTGNFSTVVSLTDYGTTGTSAGSLVDTYSSGTFGGATTVWNATQLNSAFQGYSQSGTGGAYGFDNFEATVIPEPGTLALFGLAGLAMTVPLRRRR
jgi:hypothetical protein